MKSSLKSKINLVVFLLLAALLLFFAFKGVDFGAVKEGFRNANYFWVVLALIVGFSSHIVRALRWQLLIEPIGHKPSLGNTLGALLVGYVANIAFPRLGEVTRCGSLRKTDKIPFEPLIGTVIVERAFDVIILLLLVVSVFLIRIDFFGGFIWNQTIIPIYQKTIGLLAASPLVIVVAFAFLLVLIFLIRRNVFGRKFHHRLSSIFWGVIDGLKSAYTMKNRWLFLAYTFLIWGLYWLMTYLLLLSTESTSNLGLIDGFFILVVGSLGMAAPVQGGFGAFHIITAMALGIYGISWEEGLVFAIISHESQTLLVVVTGLIYMGILFFQKRSLKGDVAP